MNNFRIKFIACLLTGTSAFATTQASLNPQQGAIRTQNEELTLKEVLTQANIDITTDKGKWNAMGYCMLGRYMANSYNRQHRYNNDETVQFLIDKMASYIDDWQEISGKSKTYAQLAKDQDWWIHAKKGIQKILEIREAQKQTFDEQMAEHVNKYFSILRDCDYTSTDVQQFLDVSIADSRNKDALGSKADRIARFILLLYSPSPRNMISITPNKRLSFIKDTLQKIGKSIVNKEDLGKLQEQARGIKFGYIHGKCSKDIRNELRELIALCDEFSNGGRNCSPKEKTAIGRTRKHLKALLKELSKKFEQ